MENITVTINYGTKLYEVLVNDIPLDIRAIEDKPIPEWFEVADNHSGWQGLIREIRDRIKDDESDLSFLFNGDPEHEKQFFRYLDENNIRYVDGPSDEERAEARFNDACKAEARGQYAAALKQYERAAELGRSDAKFQVAEYLVEGKGCDPVGGAEGRQSRALDLYVELANQGDARAMWRAAKCYRDGIGTAANEEKFLKWLKKAANAGDIDAKRELDEWQEAKRRAEEQAELERREAEARAEAERLAEEARTKEEIARKAAEEKKKAEKQREAARKADDAKTAYRLGMQYLYDKKQKNASQGIKYLTDSATAGYIDAMFELSARYKAGMGMKKDTSAAQKWFDLAAEKCIGNGDVESLCKLGFAYLAGRAVEKNVDEAEKYFRQALQLQASHCDANYGMAEVYYEKNIADPASTSSFVKGLGLGAAGVVGAVVAPVGLLATAGIAVAATLAGTAAIVVDLTPAEKRRAKKYVPLQDGQIMMRHYKVAANQGNEFAREKLKELSKYEKERKNGK